MDMFGLRIVSHPLAIDYRVWHTVERCGPPKKRRNRWRVKRHEEQRPGCYQMGNTLFMHPKLIAKLPKAAQSVHPAPASASRA